MLVERGVYSRCRSTVGGVVVCVMGNTRLVCGMLISYLQTAKTTNFVFASEPSKYC